MAIYATKLSPESVKSGKPNKLLKCFPIFRQFGIQNSCKLLHQNKLHKVKLQHGIFYSNKLNYWHAVIWNEFFGNFMKPKQCFVFLQKWNCTGNKINPSYIFFCIPGLKLISESGHPTVCVKFHHRVHCDIPTLEVR